jgi:hypothetical protein
MFQEYDSFADIKLLLNFEPQKSTCKGSALYSIAEALKSPSDSMYWRLLLISGRCVTTGERAVFGVCATALGDDDEMFTIEHGKGHTFSYSTLPT